MSDSKQAPPDFVVVGHITGPWGIRGEVKVEVITDFPERFGPSNTVYTNGQPLRIESSRPHKKVLLVKFAGVDTVADAEKLREKDLTIPLSEVHPLQAGEYYPFQLIGLRVMTSDGRYLGEICEVMTTVSNDVYVVACNGEELLIPAIEDVVKEIDLEKGEVIIEAIEGL